VSELAQAFAQAVSGGIVAGLIAWGGLRVEMRVMKRMIEAAHDRLDAIGAPAAKARLD
jgi:hypothetical protein